jgi:hypothetical protein
MIEIQRMLEAQLISATLKVCMEYDVENYEYYSQLLEKCEEYKVELRTKKNEKSKSRMPQRGLWVYNLWW